MKSEVDEKLLEAVLQSMGRCAVSTVLPTRAGEWTVQWHGGEQGAECVSFSVSRPKKPKFTPTIRIHSACLFGETFGSIECDCRAQLDAAMDEIRKSGGAFIYLFQEGRGAGLCGKIAAMELQRVRGISTSDAFQALGLPGDLRDYGQAVAALSDLGIGPEVRLITNNPQKIDALSAAGFRIIERVEPELRLPSRTIDLVRSKQEALGQIPYANLRAIQ